MKFILILFVIFFTLFPDGDFNITVNYGDFLAMGLVPLFIYDFLREKFIIDKFGKYFLCYIILLVFTAIINLTVFNGKFLNIFKTSLFSWIFYIWTYNFILLNKLSEKQFLFGIAILSGLFLFKTVPEMQQTWKAASNGFSTYRVFKSSINLNNWGYIILLFFVISLYSWSIDYFKYVSLTFSVCLAIFVYFSFSRTAYSLILFSIIWFVFYIQKIDFRRFGIPTLIVVIIITLIIYYNPNILPFKVSRAASHFMDKKVATANSDFIDTRLYTINYLPIVDFVYRMNVFQMFFGDSTSVQHSWISNSFIVTGIVGLWVYIQRFYVGIKKAYKNMLQSKNRLYGKFLLLVLLIILINDFITNTTLFLDFAGYLSFIITAFFMALIDKQENEKKHNLSD